MMERDLTVQLVAEELAKFLAKKRCEMLLYRAFVREGDGSYRPADDKDFWEWVAEGFPVPSERHPSCDLSVPVMPTLTSKGAGGD